jgi:hypothetical protein
MKRDHAEVGEEQDALLAVDDRIDSDPSFFSVDLVSTDQIRWGVLGDVLLHEALFPDSLGKPFDRESAARDVPEHAPGDAPVVVDDVALGESVLRIDHAACVAHLHGLSL